MEGGWEGKKVGTEGGGMMRSEKLECTQKLPQTQHIWHLGTPRVVHFYGATRCIARTIPWRGLVICELRTANW